MLFPITRLLDEQPCDDHLAESLPTKKLPYPKMVKDHPSRDSVRSDWGFSLIEVAMVMTILSIILGGGIATISSMRDKQQRQKTAVALEKIQEALTGYAITYGRLPCPDVGVDVNNVMQTAFDGVEDRDHSGHCRLAYGVLPWQDLGLQPFDYFGNYFTYHVAENYSQHEIHCLTTSPLMIRKDTDTGTILATNVAAVVVSHGKNDEGVINTTPVGPPAYLTRRALFGSDANSLANKENNEAENADMDHADAESHDDVNSLYLQNAGDDHIIYLSPLLLKVKLMDAGRDMTACAKKTASVETTPSIPTTTTPLDPEPAFQQK